MSGSRDTILARLDRARPPASAAPPAMTPPARPADPLGTLRARLEESGGRLQCASRDAWQRRVEWPVDLAAARHVYSTLTEPEARGVGLEAASDRDLDRLELCVLRAEFAVVENGAAWQVPDAPRDRVAALLATHLVLVVDASELVPTLHEAYQRIEPGAHGFGWFLCGPSKTADIEQALVLGAHGPRTMSLVLLED